MLAIGASLVRRRRRHAQPLPIGGLLIAGAFIESMRETGRLVPGLAVGLVLLALAGFLADLGGHRIVAMAGLAAPGAWVLATHAGLGNAAWVRAVVAGVIVVGAPLVADLDTRAGSDGLGPVLFAVSTVGVYFTIPDTDVGLALVPIAAFLALAAWPRPLVRLGAGGAAAGVGALAWVSAVGGLGRPTAVVGGVATLGLLAAEPLGRVVVGRHRGALGGDRHGAGYVVVVALAQLLVVYVASRVAGVGRSVRSAVVIAAIDLGVVVVVTTVMAGRRPEPLLQTLPHVRFVAPSGRGGKLGRPRQRE